MVGLRKTRPWTAKQLLRRFQSSKMSFLNTSTIWAFSSLRKRNGLQSMKS
ncbi:hypothetical protein CsSME_00005346 [Camellia sinensis var. sinensis]